MKERVRGVMRRWAYMLLAVVLVLTSVPAFPLSAYAAVNGTLNGLANKDIGASYTGTDDGGYTNWSVNGGNGIVGTAKSDAGACSSTKYNTTLTLTNKKDSAAILSFDYKVTFSSGKIQVAGENVAADGSYKGTLDAGDSVEVWLESGDTNNDTMIEISNLSLIVDTEATTTFRPAEHGSFTVDDASVTEETKRTQQSTVAYALSATADEGYKFYGWYSVTTQSYLSTDAEASLNFDSDQTVTAVFVTEDTPIFEVGGTRFTDLNEANAYARSIGVSKLTLVSDGTLSAGDYTISEGVTLLIPFDAGNTCYTTAPATTGNIRTDPSVYRTLTMAEGASITVNGAISVSAKHYAYSQGGAAGAPDGKYGYIYMNENSSITVSDGGALYAYGFVSGEGSVIAKSGATVYENMQIADFRGGSATSGMNNNAQKIFPLNQYFIQNIEAKLILESGADEFVYTSIYALSMSTSTAVHFIGNDGAMFSVDEGGSFTKRYLPDRDRVEITVDGDAQINSLTLSLSGMSVTSANYVLPINNCMTLNVVSGTTKITQDMALLAGSVVNIAEGATVQITPGNSLYVYDQDEWCQANYASNAKFKSVPYSPTRIYTRTNEDLTDVQLNINGTLLSDGAVYTTAGGADITSSQGTGQFILTNGAGTNTSTYMYKDYTTNYDTIPITSAKLHNASTYAGTDQEYTLTDGADVGSVYYYDEAAGMWKMEGESETYTVTWVNEDGTVLETDEGVAAGTMPEYNGETPAKEGDAEHRYVFNGWTPELSEVAGDITYTATFTEVTNAYTITWENWDGTVLETDENVEYGAKPSYDGETPTRPADAQYTYTFTGWTPAVDEVTGSVVYTATYHQTLNQYTVTWKNYDGSVLETDKGVKYGAMPQYNGQVPTRPDGGQVEYVFAGWTPEVTAVTGDVTYTAAFTEQALVKHAVTFDANGGTGTMEPQTIINGRDNQLAPNAFTRENYFFTGWNTAADGSGATYADRASIMSLDADITLYAQWKLANGWFTDEGGTGYVRDGEKIVRQWETIEDNEYYFDEGGYIVKGVCEVPSPDGSETTLYAFDDSTGVFQKDVTGLFLSGADIYWLESGKAIKGAGLVRIVLDSGEINYYYFGADGKAYRGTADQAYFVVEKNNGLGLPEGINYPFGEDGVIKHFDDTTINGIYHDEGSGNYYFCVDGVIIANGLMKIDGSYYYARTSTGAFVTGQTYWITKTNGLLEEGIYTFDDTGKIVFPDEEDKKNGIVEENGRLYYYVDGVVTGAGLIRIDGSYYYVRTSTGEVVQGRTYWITATNGLLPSGQYEFDEDGKMVNPPVVDPDDPEPELKDGIVEESGSLYYYENGVLTPAGLIQVDGDYYYAKTSTGEVVHGQSYWITATNGLLPSKMYEFAEDGRLILE